MERVYLTRDEKRVLQVIYTYAREVAVEKLRYERFQQPLFNLQKKGFIEYGTDDRGLVKSITLKPYAYDYICSNPKLKNPFNWQLWQFIITILLTIATIIGLFVRCTLITHN